MAEDNQSLENAGKEAETGETAEVRGTVPASVSAETEEKMIEKPAGKKPGTRKTGTKKTAEKKKTAKGKAADVKGNTKKKNNGKEKTRKKKHTHVDDELPVYLL